MTDALVLGVVAALLALGATTRALVHWARRDAPDPAWHATGFSYTRSEDR